MTNKKINHSSSVTSLQQIKLPTFPSIQLPKLLKTKFKEFKPLQVRDIIAVQIYNNSRPDRTDQLKNFLLRQRRLTVHQQQGIYSGNQLLSAERYPASLNVPHFAKVEYSEFNLLKHHLSNKNRAKSFSEIQSYQNSLKEVQLRISKSMSQYEIDLEQGSQSLKSMEPFVQKTLTNVHLQRSNLKTLLQKQTKYSLNILKRHRRIENIKKTIFLAKAWKSSKVSQILSKNIESFSTPQQIISIFEKINESLCLKSTNNNSFKTTTINGSQSNNIDDGQQNNKVKRLIEQRKTQIIEHIQYEMQNSIIFFQSKQQYMKTYLNYNTLLRILIPQAVDVDVVVVGDVVNNSTPTPTPTSNQKYLQYHQLQRPNLILLIEENCQTIYMKLLQKSSSSTLGKIQLLNETAYFDFCGQLLEEFIKYFSHWHKVNSVHVQNATPYKNLFTELRSTVFNIFTQKIANIIKFSHKFVSLSFSYKIQLCQKIYDFIEAGSEWMGKTNINIFDVLRQKIINQCESYLKEVNGNIKFTFIEQFSQEGLNKTKVKDKIKNLFKNIGLQSFDLLEKYQWMELVDSVKVKKILSNNNIISNNSYNDDGQNQFCYQQQHQQQQQQEQCLYQQQIQLLIASPLPSLKTTQYFLQSVIEYFHRKTFIPEKNQKNRYSSSSSSSDHQNTTYFFDQILQHIKFLIFLIFKVCVCEKTKRKLTQHNSQAERVKQLNLIVEKGQLDDAALLQVSKMRQSYLRRRTYLELLKYMADEIGTKYDNVIVSGHLSVDKLFLNLQQNQEQVSDYNKKITMLIEDIILIIRKLHAMATLTIKKTKGKQKNGGVVSLNSRHQLNHLKQQNIIKKLNQLEASIVPQIGFLYFEYYNETVYSQYAEKMQPLLKSYDWQIKKFTSEISTIYKQYKLKILEIFRSTVTNTGIKDPQISQQFSNKHLEVFYKALLYSYSKIDKVNDNGRQLIRLDLIQISNILKQLGYKPGSWENWFEKYLQICNQRTTSSVIDKLQHLGIIYPIACWKSNLLWIISESSTKEKNKFFSEILKIYAAQLRDLPHIC